MDVGRQRAVGLGALSLWTLDVVRQCVGVVAGTGVGRRVLPSVLGAGVCVVLWLGLGLRFWLGRVWLAADRSLRLFPSLVGRISRALRRGREKWV
jgi:hypothetical protein